MPGGNTHPWWQRLVAKGCGWLCALSVRQKWSAGILAALVAVVVVGFGWADFFALCLGYADVVADNVKGDNAAKAGAGICASQSAGLFRRGFLIALVAIAGIVMAAIRSYALFRQSKVAAHNFKLSAHNSKLAARNLRLSEKRLLSERLAIAAELMAKENKDGNPAISARISGIHIMEKLAISAPKEFAEQVVKNLIAYIKEHAQLTAMPKLIGQVIPAEPRILGADVKAAFDVLNNILGVPQIKNLIEDKILDFSRQNFSGLNFEHVCLLHCKLWEETDFRGANLNKASLQNAKLQGAKFQGAILESTNFLNAKMPKANLQGTRLHDAILTGADLLSATVEGAILSARLEKIKTWPIFGATNMTHANIESIPMCVKERAMSHKIWHGNASWAEGIHEYKGTPLSLGNWDNCALIGLVRNMVAYYELPGAKSLAKKAAQSLSDNNAPEEYRELVKRIMPAED